MTWYCQPCRKVNEIPLLGQIVKLWVRDFNRPVSIISFTGLAVTRLTRQVPIGTTNQMNAGPFNGRSTHPLQTIEEMSSPTSLASGTS